MLFPLPAQTQEICGERNEIVTTLRESFGEYKHFEGLATSGNLIEVFISTKTGTWTIILSRPNGISCPYAAGTNWLDMNHDYQHPHPHKE